ncbi:MAG: hypothetical protein JXQ75_23150, partial [Phycisphaerae bacterium]|nr:hypothetical protein [Phycisphaerae bacterium]
MNTRIASMTRVWVTAAGARIPSRTYTQRNPFLEASQEWESCCTWGREGILGPASEGILGPASFSAQ